MKPSRKRSTSNQPYETSAVYYPKVGRIHPDPAIVTEVVDRLIAAKRPIIIGGRGVPIVLRSGQATPS